MISPLALLIPSSRLRGRAVRRGRAVSVDSIAEPRQRPRYPRYVEPFVAAVADVEHSARRQRPLTPPEMRAEAAAYRAQVARQRCIAREARRAARPA